MASMADDLDGTAGLEPDAPALQDTPEAPVSGATAPAAPPAEEHFIDPSQLPDEIKPHWKRMHGAYNKKLAEIRTHQQDIDLVSRYRTDPQFQRAFLLQEAQRLGLQLGGSQAPAPNGQPAPASPPGVSGEVPPSLVAAVRARLAPELQWMAESQAAAAWEAIRGFATPMLEREQQREVTTKTAEYEALAEQLGTQAPGWEQHEDDMMSLLDFLESGRMTDRRWGSKLALLYNAVTGNAAASQAAVTRMAEAGRNRVSTGLSGRQVVPNTTERVLKARTNREAIQIAAEEAEKELRRLGQAVPE
jgi:hypothetical protein